MMGGIFIKANSCSELYRIFEIIQEDINLASDKYQLYHTLADELEKTEEIFNKAKYFWDTIMKAIQESMIMHLCKTYDTQRGSISLFNLCVLIEDCNRKSKNQFFKELIDENRFPNDKAIREYKGLISSKQNEIVDKLPKWRNNYFAHKGNGLIENDGKILKENPIEDLEIKQLIDNAKKVIDNLYHAIFEGTWSAYTSTRVSECNILFDYLRRAGVSSKS